MADDTQSEKPKRNWLWPVSIIAMIVIVALLISYWYWDWFVCQLGLLGGPEDRVFRLITIVAGFFAFGVAVWRSSTAARQAKSTEEQVALATKQAKSTEKQIELATKGQYSERFVAAVGQVASEKLAIRLGGLASLDALSRETADQYERVWDYLGSFLRYPPALQGWSPKSRDDIRPDIAAIAGMIRNRSEKQKEWGKKFPLPLYWSKLEHTNLQDAFLQGAILYCADLQHADLHGAILYRANLHGAYLHGANLEGTKLTNALFGSYSDQRQDLGECKNLTPDQFKGTWYEQEGSAPILPDGWPEDCKPRPIGWDEWSKMRDEFMEKLLKGEQG